MHLKTYLLVALVMVLAMGMGCGSGSSIGTTSGGGSNTVVGTWTLVSSTGGVYPQQIVFTTNGGTYYYSNGSTTPFSWSPSGNVITISTGSNLNATITLASSSVNTFTLNGVSGSGVYNRVS